MIKTGSGRLNLNNAGTYNGGMLVMTDATQAATSIAIASSGSLGLVIGSPVTAASAAVNFAHGAVSIVGITRSQALRPPRRRGIRNDETPVFERPPPEGCFLWVASPTARGAMAGEGIHRRLNSHRKIAQNFAKFDFLVVMKPLDASDWPRLVRPGSRVFIGGGASVPFALVASMLEKAAGFKDVELVHIHGLGDTPWIAPQYEQVLRTNSFYLTPALRDAVERGQADYTPCAMSEVASLFKSGPLPLDVALIQVSPPDADGFC
ncbi:MAG: hypothetical protein RLZZ214_3204, partial [Verrucomicrobiota bacterium]